MSYFPEVPGSIPFEGPKSKNPLAFKYYNASEKVGGKSMEDHLRFSVCFWHTFKATGADPFGVATLQRPWDSASDPIQKAKDTLDAAFEFFQKLGVKFWTFHDRDISPEGATYDESRQNLSDLANYAKAHMDRTGVQLLWGTANLFSHPRYQSGAATNPNPDVFAWAAAQVKNALEITHRLNGAGYTFWGGREGFDTLLNTRMKQERAQLAELLRMAVNHGQKIGFKGNFYIEPKPKEPTTHQYDSDVASCLNFLREFDLLKDFKLNLETNHATLAGHSMLHEMQLARTADALGSLDANTGDELIGWDTDQFPTSIYLTTQMMLEVLDMGGISPGGLNFDAKVRRQSHEPIDLFYAHIGGIDTFARGLKIAYKIQQDGRLAEFVRDRYKGWILPFGEKILTGQRTMEDCEDHVRRHGEPTLASGRQEFLENLINEFL